MAASHLPIYHEMTNFMDDTQALLLYEFYGPHGDLRVLFGEIWLLYHFPSLRYTITNKQGIALRNSTGEISMDLIAQIYHQPSIYVGRQTLPVLCLPRSNWNAPAVNWGLNKERKKQTNKQTNNERNKDTRWSLKRPCLQHWPNSTMYRIHVPSQIKLKQGKITILSSKSHISTTKFWP